MFECPYSPARTASVTAVLPNEGLEQDAECGINQNNQALQYALIGELGVLEGWIKKRMEG